MRPFREFYSTRDLATFKDGRYEAYIEHPPMQGVTPEMLI